ncbi:MAG: HPr(Ser) kinase/phosphatase [Oscillospiraceae bacterium]|jgi:HPr kinase/phosphorylase|nr:HPr(Ser) kinase/phosphatase [Oscillospiraceae bacterium]
MNNRSVPLRQLVEEFKLSIAYQSTDYDTICVEVDEVSRPGLPLTGFFEHFERLRVEVLGYVEMTFLEDQTPEKRLEIFDRLFAYRIPALVISRGQQPHPECIDMAKKHNITILLAQETTSYVISNLISYLKSALAPRITRHGVLMEVYGEGIFITGESGIGKSETAVELLKRGHRLIADDAVVLKMTSSSQLTGSAPSLIRNYIELRGIGVINVANLFGMGAVKEEAVVNLVVNIVPWEAGKHYDRMGLEDQTVDLLGVKLPCVTIPVSPGRNLAVILEVAAMNNRQKRLGYNAALELSQQLDRHFDHISR